MRGEEGRPNVLLIIVAAIVLLAMFLPATLTGVNQRIDKAFGLPTATPATPFEQGPAKAVAGAVAGAGVVVSETGITVNIPANCYRRLNEVSRLWGWGWNNDGSQYFKLTIGESEKTLVKRQVLAINPTPDSWELICIEATLASSATVVPTTSTPAPINTPTLVSDTPSIPSSQKGGDIQEAGLILLVVISALFGFLPFLKATGKGVGKGAGVVGRRIRRRR